MRILLLHNPSAGDGNVPGDELRKLFTAEGHAVTYRDTHKADINPADAEGVDLVVVAGGDGTVGSAVRALHDKGCPLAVIPFGTANNIAHGLGLVVPPDRIAKTAGTARRRPLDIGRVTGVAGTEVFLEGVGVGALAELVAAGDAGDMTYEEEKRFGVEAPGPFVRRASPTRWRVCADGAPLPDDLLLVEVLNMPRVGPGLPIGCADWPDDRRLDVAFLPPEARDAFANWLDGDRSGRPAGLQVVQGRRVTLEWPGGPLRIDDHFPPRPDDESPVHVEIELAPEQLEVLVPEMETNRR